VADGVVKVDKSLLRKVEEFVKKNKFSYSSKKQVVNLALVEFLKLNSFNNLENNKKRRYKK